MAIRPFHTSHERCALHRALQLLRRFKNGVLPNLYVLYFLASGVVFAHESIRVAAAAGK